MRKGLGGLVVTLAVLLFAAPSAAARGGAAKLSAGAASVDITPPVGTPMFAYTARSRAVPDPDDPSRGLQILADPDENSYARTFEPSEGIHARVRSSALVVERGGERFALVSTDLGGLPYALVQEVLGRIESTGIDGEHLLISATHTHSSTGPIWPGDSQGYAALGGDLFDRRVFDLTAKGIASSIIRAAGRLRPARIGVGEAKLRDASSNRSLEAYQRNPGAPQDEEAAERAAINPTVTVLRVDARSGRPIAVWSNFAVHPTTFGDDNLLFSGDHVSTTLRMVEARLGRGERGGGPGPVLVWANGAEGDVSEDGDPDEPDGEPLQYLPNSFATANLIGRRIGVGILGAWREAGRRMSGRLPLRARRTFVAFDGTAANDEPVGPLEVLGAGGITAPDGFCAPADGFAGPGQGRKFPVLEGTGLVPSVQAVSLFRVGPLGVAAFPSEITTEMGRRLTGAVERDSEGRLRDVVIAGLTNGYSSYTATPEEYDACLYEGSFTLFGRQQGPRYQDAVLSLVEPLLTGSPAPPGDGEPAPPPRPGDPETDMDVTPEAGEPLAQPDRRVRRYGRAVFSWRAGDPAVDPVRGDEFVRLRRRVDGRWRRVGTDDGVEDITVLDDEADVWTETWQFGPCAPVGRYRFVVHGFAVTEEGGAPQRYKVRSDSFRVTPTAPLELIDAEVEGRRARARLAYPDPGEEALLALPRRVRSGRATLIVRDAGRRESVPARLDRDRLAFVARVSRGAQVVDVRAHDRCGNSAR